MASKFLDGSKIYILHNQTTDESVTQVVPAKVLYLGLFESQFKPSPRIVQITPVL
jgi:hypothetical protein